MDLSRLSQAVTGSLERSDPKGKKSGKQTATPRPWTILNGRSSEQQEHQRRQERRAAAGHDDANIESNLGVLGLGGTGVRVSSQIFLADPEAPGIGHSYGFDLDADEMVPTRSRHYTYTLVQQTGGIPAAGIFSFSEMIGDRLLTADLADLDKTAARYQATVRRAVESSLYNVTVPVFSAGGGVGHGLFRSIHKAIPHGRTLTVPLIVLPGSHQALPVRVSAAAAVGRFIGDGEHPVVLMVENDRLERTKDRLGRQSGRRDRNRPVTAALRIMGAAIDHAFAHREADGNIDRALLNFARGEGPTRATLGVAHTPCLGTGEASLLDAVRQAVANPLARLDGHDHRLLVFATVPNRMDVESARLVLEESAFNLRERGWELTGAFLGRTSSYTCDVAIVATGDVRPRFLDRELRGIDPDTLRLEVRHKIKSAELKLAKARNQKSLDALVKDVDPQPYLQSAEDDMEKGLDWLQEAVR